MTEFFSEGISKPLDAATQELASNFSCGNTYIDQFIRSSSALDAKYGKTYVWVTDDESGIIGFYNIAAGSMDLVNGSMRTKMGGSIHINSFAIDERYQKIEVYEGKHFSDVLLVDCLERCRFIRDQIIGCSFITLQSTLPGISLYKRHDFFEPEEDMQITKDIDKEHDCVPMYWPFDIE